MRLFNLLPRRSRPVSPSVATQVIGLCRFSYPTLDGFQSGPATLPERIAYLHDPVRLDERFRLFEAFTLPSIRAQTDADFTFLIVHGSDLPKAQRDRLHDLVAGIPQVVVQAHEPGPHRPVMKGAINSVRRPGCYSIQFRNDDDDAVGTGFVASLRKVVQNALPLFQANRHVSVSQTRGWNACASALGIHAAPVQRIYPAVAFAIVFRPEVQLSVMNFAHHDIWKHMPTLTLADPDMLVRGGNAHNDSGTQIGTDLPLLTPDQEALFQRAFGISAAQVRALYAPRPAGGRG